MAMTYLKYPLLMSLILLSSLLLASCGGDSSSDSSSSGDVLNRSLGSANGTETEIDPETGLPVRPTGNFEEDSNDDGQRNIPDDPPPAPVPIFDTNWRAVLLDTGDGFDCVNTSTTSCNQVCRGTSRARNYVDQVETNTFLSCDRRQPGDGNPWTLLFQRAKDIDPSIGLPAGAGSAVLREQAGLEIEVDVAEAGEYYLVIYGVVEANADLTATVNGESRSFVAPGLGALPGKCFVNQKFAFTAPKSTIKFKNRAARNSLHFQAYRILETVPDGVSPCGS